MVYVDGAAPCDIGDGTMAAPFCQITHALDHVAMNDPSLGWTIKVKTGNYIQPSLVVPEASNVLAIVGDGGIAKIRSTAAADAADQPGVEGHARQAQPRQQRRRHRPDLQRARSSTAPT